MLVGFEQRGGDGANVWEFHVETRLRRGLYQRVTYRSPSGVGGDWAIRDSNANKYPKAIVHLLFLDQNTTQRHYRFSQSISSFEPPDLVLALPFAPESDGSSVGGITVVGQVNVDLGAVDEDTVLCQ